MLRTLTKQDFQNTFRSWHNRWDRCLSYQGDYFEGNGGV